MRNSSNGLIKFAEALVIVCTKAGVPSYSCVKSKHVYKQYQHVAIVCMMKLFRLHYRSVVELLEITPGIRDALGLKRMPHYTTVQKFFRRFSTTEMDSILGQTVVLFGIEEASVAIDSTGFSSNYASRYYMMIKYRHEGGVWSNSYMKQTLTVDADRQVVIADLPTKEHNSDFPYLVPALKRARRKVKITKVIADRGYDSEDNNKFVVRRLKAESLIRVRIKENRRIGGRLRRESAKNFDWDEYAKRNVIESVFSVIKRKFGDTLYSRSLRLQKKELKVVCIAYNLNRYVRCLFCLDVFYTAV